MRESVFRHKDPPGSTANDPQALLRTIEPTYAFVGREKELEIGRLALEQALAGRAGLVILEGEPGVGKTRLVEEISRRAVSLGFLPAWGRCFEGRGAPPYWPWIGVIRELTRGAGGGSFPTGDRRGIDRIARYLPEILDESSRSDIRDHPGELSSSSQATDQERFDLFDAISSLLRAAAQSSPVAIAIDDLHEADPDSLALLRFVVRDLVDARLLIFVTCRSREFTDSTSISRALGALMRRGIRVQLSGFGRGDVAQYVHRVSGFEANDDIVDALCRATGGNPLFLREFMRLLLSEGPLSVAAIDTILSSLPEGVRSVVARRLDNLSDETQTALRAAAAIGLEFDLALVERVTRLPNAELVSALDQASSLGLIGRVADHLWVFRFNHALIAETIKSEVGAEQLRRLHHEIAATLEEIHRDDQGPVLTQIAEHYFNALPLGTVRNAIEFTRRAAEQASEHLAFDEAARLYTMALSALDSTADTDDALRCELLLGLGFVETRIRAKEQAVATFKQVIASARQLSMPKYLIRAVLGWGNAVGGMRTFNRDIIEPLEEALRVVESSDDRSRARLMARLAAELYWTDDRERSSRLAREAVEVARRSGHTSTLVTTLWYRHWMQWGPDNAEQRLAAATEMANLAEQSAEWNWALRAREMRAAAFLEMGQLREIETEIAACAEISARLGPSSGIVERLRAGQAMIHGDFDECERYLNEALISAQRRNDQSLLIGYAGTLAYIRGEQGRMSEVEGILQLPQENLPGFAPLRCGFALLYVRDRRLDDARIQFEYLAVEDFQWIPRDWNWLGAIGLLGEICAALDDRARAAKLYAMLAPYAGRSVTLGFGESYYGPVANYLGLLATTLDWFDRAEVHFEAAIRFNLAMGASPCLNRTRIGYASMLLSRGLAGDWEKTRELLDSTIASADTLGMKEVGGKARELKLRAIATNGAAKSQSPDQVDEGSRAIQPTRIRGTLKREGDFWTATYQGKVSRLRHAKGLSFIAHLLSQPRIEVHVSELSEIVDSTYADNHARHGHGADALRRSSDSDAGPVLDSAAKAAYRQRLADLRAELEEVRSFNNLGRAEKLSEEIEFLTHEIVRAVGLRGRERRSGSQVERTRVRVTNAIRAAIAQINKHNPALAGLLSDTIHTGSYCSYRPSQEASSGWEF